jgi:hypothetical protein
MRRITLLAVVVLVVVTVVQFSPLGRSTVGAHPGAHAPTPPTYDWNTATVGTQPPTSSRLANPSARLFSTFRLSFNVIVPLAQLQAILPAGYLATELAPAGSGLATVILQFRFQERLERVGVGMFGPTSGLFVFHPARNGALNRSELLLLAAEDSNTPAADAFNAVFGPGNDRLAEVETEIEEKAGQLKFTFEVEDEGIGLKLKVRAQGPAAIDTQGAHADAGGPLRGLNNGATANAAYWFGAMADSRSVPITSTNFSLRIGSGRFGDGILRLPGGALDVMGVGPSFTFIRWFEVPFQLEE